MQPPDFWRGPCTSVAATALTPFGWLYAGIGCLRRAFARPARMPVPVLCIGNLVLGGAGKTPLAIDFGNRLAAHGRAVHFLTRGYGGTARGPLRVDLSTHTAADVGDEALLLARHGPTWMSANRPAGAKAAADAGAEVIVMDDGFQNPSLYKDLSLVVVDGSFGLGNGCVFPAGPLREPASRGLARAQAIVVIGGAWTPPHPTVPVLRAHLRPGPEAADLAGTRVFAFAGIGRPEKFYATLNDVGCDIAGTRSFDDHHPYSATDLEEILTAARGAGAIPVTTEKDLVRLPDEHRPNVAVLSVSLAWDDADAADAVLSVLLEKRA